MTTVDTTRAGAASDRATSLYSMPEVPDAGQRAKPAVSGDALVLEDDAIIALDIEATLLTLGASRVHVVSSEARALEVMRTQTISVAVLDIQLGPIVSHSIAELLAQARIPFVLASGHASGRQFATRHGVPLVQKPFALDGLCRAIELVARARPVPVVVDPPRDDCVQVKQSTNCY